MENVHVNLLIAYLNIPLIILILLNLLIGVLLAFLITSLNSLKNRKTLKPYKRVTKKKLIIRPNASQNCGPKIVCLSLGLKIPTANNYLANNKPSMN
ncbi:lipopolysaccharide assembly protein LapA domain-containing protein [Secundilactobacillus kimchicus]|uniref:lipopolysaccharide assembly protein LapA domain-containing protein n=1 Tax=Secundilactobacillus kimchicus TaxID=528209 RepID=UPI003522D925